MLKSLIAALLLVSATAYAKPWKLNVKFHIGASECRVIGSTACQDNVISKLRWEIDEAERLFSRSPRLEITPTFVYTPTKGGKNLNSLSFKNQRNLSKWMDKHFDHVARSRTSGHFTVVVAGEIWKNGKRIGGNSNFPHSIVPFNRKRGVLMVLDNFDSRCRRPTRGVLAHELGHTLGVKHTFERYVTKTCNRNYPKRKGGSVKSNGSINIMDYNHSFTTASGLTCPRVTYLNDCQARLASRTRKRYQTVKGKTKYRRLKGLQ